jgi:hypothetical protein
MLALSVGVISSCASIPPPPPDAAPPLSIAERIGVPGVMHSSIIEPVGLPTLSSTAAGRDEVLLTINYNYRYTAVLKKDVVGFSITVPGVQAPAGSPGYYAGTFAASGAYGSRGGMDLWCFLPSAVGGKRENLCLLRTNASLAAIAPTRLNPYLWTYFSPATGTFDYVEAPVFERRDVVIPADLRLQYRFEGWSKSSVKLSEYAVGRKVRDLEIEPDSQGIVRLRTIAGDFAIAASPDDSARATISAVLERTT